MQGAQWGGDSYTRVEPPTHLPTPVGGGIRIDREEQNWASLHLRKLVAQAGEAAEELDFYWRGVKHQPHF